MTKITKEALLADKWHETGNPVVPVKKELLKPRGDYDHPDSVHLVIHKYNNVEQFAIAFPDGAFLDINPESMEDLYKIQSLIVAFNPVY